MINNYKVAKSFVSKIHNEITIENDRNEAAAVDSFFSFSIVFINAIVKVKGIKSYYESNSYNMSTGMPRP